MYPYLSRRQVNYTAAQRLPRHPRTFKGLETGRTPTSLGDSNTHEESYRTTWTLAQPPAEPAELFMLVVKPLPDLSFASILGNLLRHNDIRFATTPQG